MLSKEWKITHPITSNDSCTVKLSIATKTIYIVFIVDCHDATLHQAPSMRRMNIKQEFILSHLQFDGVVKLHIQSHQTTVVYINWAWLQKQSILCICRLPWLLLCMKHHLWAEWESSRSLSCLIYNLFCVLFCIYFCSIKCIWTMFAHLVRWDADRRLFEQDEIPESRPLQSVK